MTLNPNAAPYFGYTLSFTDECGQDHADEFTALSDRQAVVMALGMCRGQEGLWSGVSLSGGPTDDAIEFNPF